MVKKRPLYEFAIPSERHPEDKRLRRIRYLPGHVYNGHPGGFMQAYANLQRYGHGTAPRAQPQPAGGVFGSARVDNGAFVDMSTCVEEYAHVTDRSRVSGLTAIAGRTVVRNADILTPPDSTHGLVVRDTDLGTSCSRSLVQAEGEIESSIFWCALLSGCLALRNCRFTGLANFSGRASLSGISASMNLHISGTRIHLAGAGAYLWAPRHEVSLALEHPDDLAIIPSRISEHSIVAYRDGRVRIGCQRYVWSELQHITSVTALRKWLQLRTPKHGMFAHALGTTEITREMAADAYVAVQQLHDYYRRVDRAAKKAAK